MAGSDPWIPIMLGVAGGMRAFVPPAALAVDGRVSRGASTAILALSAGELVADKHRAMASRLEPRGLGARLVSSGLSGRAVAGRGAVPLAAAAAFASAHICARARAGLAARTGRDWPWALAEDVLALNLATFALRRSWR